MRDWVDGYISKMSPEDRGTYEFLIQLREVSSHDLAVQPERSTISAEVVDKRLGEADSNIHGNLLYQHDFGSPGAENVIQTTKVSAKYFLSNGEDVLSFCSRVVFMLENMVREAYSKFP